MFTNAWYKSGRCKTMHKTQQLSLSKWSCSILQAKMANLMLHVQTVQAGETVHAPTGAPQKPLPRHTCTSISTIISLSTFSTTLPHVSFGNMRTLGINYKNHQFYCNNRELLQFLELCFEELFKLQLQRRYFRCT